MEINKEPFNGIYHALEQAFLKSIAKEIFSNEEIINSKAKDVEEKNDNKGTV